ncbi:MAG TPA: hypothetical protein VFS37_13735 [Conexibacter sp.]|nr:hypothetical protein [Conexibacter sp.]
MRRMTMLWGLTGLLAIAPSALAASAPRATGPLPVVAAAGGQLEVAMRLGGPLGRAGLVLSSSRRSAKGGTRLGGSVRRAGRRVRIRASVPASIAPGRRLTLFACANAAAGTRSGRGCRALGLVPTSGPSLEERLDAAVAARRLSRGQAGLYALYAANGDPRLPLELRARAAGGGGGVEGLLRDAAASADSLPRALKRKLVWYFVPPAGRGSAWRGVSGRGRARRGRAASPLASAAARARGGADCVGYESLRDSPYSGSWRVPWVGVPTTDGKAVVWYQEGESRAQASARAYARYLPEIWRKLTREFREPKSDARERCFHGPDGRFDVYVNDTIVWLAAGGGTNTGFSAITMPYPSARGRWCTDRPSWIAIDVGESRFTLAHEFMHAIEFAHRYATCENVSWWDEGVANWAADFVYPSDNVEQGRWPDWLREPLAMGSIAEDDYEAFPFWMMLQRTLGTGVLRQVFTQLGSQASVPAVNAAIPGGYARQWPRFAMHLLNQPPVGTLGFELSQSFRAWDGWSLAPSIPSTQSLALGGLNERTLMLPSQNPDTGRLTVSAYHRVTGDDRAVREVRFRNGNTGAGVLAALRLADGSWKLQDWSGRSEVTLCRDKADEDVQELLIVSVNKNQTGSLGPFAHELRGRDACRLPTYSGTFSAVATYDEQDVGTGNSLTARWSGSVTFTPASEDELRFFSFLTPYRIAGGSVSYEMRGRVDDCDWSASISFALPTLDTQALGTFAVYPGDPRTYGMLVGMPLSQTTTGTKSNCADPTDNGDFLWLLSAGVPALLATGPQTTAPGPGGIPIASPTRLPIPPTGPLAGGARGGDTATDPVGVEWTWNLSAGA